MRDLSNHINPLPAIPPGAAVTDNTPVVSAIIDRQGYDSLTFVLITGNDTDTDATFAVTIDAGETANLADAVAVTDADLIGTLALTGYTFADDNKTRKVGYMGDHRYVRLTVTPTNNTGNCYVAATAILGHASVQPTSNPPA